MTDQLSAPRHNFADSPHKPGSVKEMIAIAFPMVISFACDTVMTFTDRLFLSRLGPEHMSAAMAGGISVFMMMSFCMGLVGYTTALAAQYLGAREKSQCSKVLTQAMIIVIAAYPLLIALRPLAHELFSLFGISSAQLALQKDYFDILMFGVALSLGRHALSSYFSGIGRTQVVMAASLLAMVVNVLLNYCLIYGQFGFPALGIKGAAIGTIAASACAVLLLSAVYLGHTNAREFGVWNSVVFDRAVMKKLLRYGYPAGMEFALNILAFSGMVFLFQGQGPADAAAITIVFNWDMVTFVPLLGIEIGVTSLVGRYIGAKRIPYVYRSVRSGLKLGLAYAALMLVIFICLPQQLVHLFRPDIPSEIFTQALPLAVSMVKLVSLYVVAEVLLIVYIGALRGAGDTLGAMVISVGIHWVIVAALYIILRVIQLPTYYAWAAMVGIFILLSGLPYLRYRQGGWKKIHLIEQG